MYKLAWLRNKSKSEILNLDDKFWNILSKKVYPLTKGTLRIPISLEPFLVSEKEFDSLNLLLKQLISALIKLSERYFFDKELQETIVINEKRERFN